MQQTHSQTQYKTENLVYDQNFKKLIEYSSLMKPNLTYLLPLCLIGSLSAQQSISSFTLVNASTDVDMVQLFDGDTIHLTTTGSSLNIRVETSPSTVGSVVFELDGSNVQTESVAPYALFGDNSGDYNSGSFTTGWHTLKATPYTSSSASGTPGTSKEINFFITQSTSPPPPTGTVGCVFEENAGVVIIEAENTTISGDWLIKTDQPGYTGSGFIFWNGSNHFHDPGHGLLEYTIKIQDTGTYRFLWRSMIAHGNQASEHNDSWLRFPDADDFYGEKNGHIVYPKGTGQTPVPNGGGADGYFKIYMHAFNWKYYAKTSDNDAHDIFVYFENPGEYTMQISGRSFGHAIDRIAMYKTNSSYATDPNSPESNCLMVGPTSNHQTGLSSSESRAYPNPFNHQILLAGNESMHYKLFNLQGKLLLQGYAAQINTKDLPSGIYILETQNNQSKSVDKIIKTTN